MSEQKEPQAQSPQATPAPAWVLIGAAVVAVLGSALPWLDLGYLQVSGLRGWGWFVLIAAAPDLPPPPRGPGCG